MVKFILQLCIHNWDGICSKLSVLISFALCPAEFCSSRVGCWMLASFRSHCIYWVLVQNMLTITYYIRFRSKAHWAHFHLHAPHIFFEENKGRGNRRCECSCSQPRCYSLWFHYFIFLYLKETFHQQLNYSSQTCGSAILAVVDRPMGDK